MHTHTRYVHNYIKFLYYAREHAHILQETTCTQKEGSIYFDSVGWPIFHAKPRFWRILRIPQILGFRSNFQESMEIPYVPLMAQGYYIF